MSQNKGARAGSHEPAQAVSKVRNPGLAKLEAITGAMGFPPELWFGSAEEKDRAPDRALVAALEDRTLVAILEEASKIGVAERRLLLALASGYDERSCGH